MLLAALVMNWTLGLSSAVALSAVAVIGYLFGRSQKQTTQDEPTGHGGIDRAARIAKKLESIADDLRQDLALHRNEVEKFKGRLRRAEESPDDSAWTQLKQDAEAMVGPTLQLVSQLSTAYDQIRQQGQALANFTGGRTDPLTGLANCRSLDEQLAGLLKAREKGGGDFSVAVVSLDAEAGDSGSQLQTVSKMLASGLRGDDFAARYGVGELVVVLPGTRLTGAGVFAARLRANAIEKCGVTLCCGLAESLPGDSVKSLLARGDSAAYSARAAGADQQFIHTGAAIRPDKHVRPVKEATGKEASSVEQPSEPATEKFNTIPPLALAGPAVCGSLVADL